MIDGEEAYRLKSSSSIMGYDSQVILCDNNDQILKIWVFKHTCNEVKLDISASPLLIYSYSYNSTNPGNFISPEGEQQASLQLVGKSRRFELNGMEFKHNDFESLIHFRCPEELLHQTILLAHLLFTPPIFGNS